MPFQMALDEILLQRTLEGQITQPVLRIYFSSEPWITTGYSDPGPFEPGVRICKRVTGGGRVNHGSDVIFSLTARKEDDSSFKSVSESYWKIHEAVKMAFEKLGENPRFYRCDEKLPRGGECFVYPIATDLALDNKKVAGGAQKRTQGALLHQESVQIPKRMNAFHFASALETSFEAQFQMDLLSVLWNPEVLAAAKSIGETKYSNPDKMAEPSEALLAETAL